MRGWYEELRGRLDCFQVLAERLDAGFTANQVGAIGVPGAWGSERGGRGCAPAGRRTANRPP